MTIHREGYATIALVSVIALLLDGLAIWLLGPKWPILALLVFVATFAIWLIVLWFFRVPTKTLTLAENKIIAPADGKVVVIEEVEDTEYFHDKRLQLSIFMNPFNVHQNLNAISGEVVYSQYHPGKYLVAWHPKSSTENERHSVVYLNNGRKILVKQIAGALARRIVNYLKPGMIVSQGQEMGFIKFGSRVDLLLPVGTKVTVKLNDKVTAGVSVIAEW